MEKETATTKKETKAPQFRRRDRVGYNFLSVKEKESVFVEITGYETRENKKGDVNPFWTAVNLKTGEDGLIYIDGGLKAQTSALGGPEKCVGKCFEILHKGHAEFELPDGETARVNKYDVFEIDPI